MFLKEVTYAHPGWIQLIKITVKQEYCEILLQFKITFLFEYISKSTLFLWGQRPCDTEDKQWMLNIY